MPADTPTGPETSNLGESHAQPQSEPPPTADPTPEGGLPDSAETAPDSEAAAEADSAATDVEVSYEHTPRGHRVTRRTVHRREVVEDTEENITDSYPVPHQPPSPVGHPAPVG